MHLSGWPCHIVCATWRARALRRSASGLSTASESQCSHSYRSPHHLSASPPHHPHRLITSPPHHAPPSYLTIALFALRNPSYTCRSVPTPEHRQDHISVQTNGHEGGDSLSSALRYHPEKFPSMNLTACTVLHCTAPHCTQIHLQQMEM